MELVKSRSDIEANLMTLERYRRSEDPADVQWYKGMIERGICFILRYVEGQLIIGPSRFLGYEANTRELHETNPSRNGGVTNERIDRILAIEFKEDTKAEGTYQQFCHDLNIRAWQTGTAGKHRKYIWIDGELDEEEIVNQIRNSKDITETEKERLIRARVGQGAFRENLLKYWNRRCSVTELTNESMLRASHIKPWKSSSHKERLDVSNGLLLLPNLDQAFDQGVITFDEQGQIRISGRLTSDERSLLGIAEKMKLRKISAEQEHYLQYHRREIFRP